MSRTGTLPGPGSSDSMPPPPSGTGAEDRLAWLAAVARWTQRQIDILRADNADLHAQLAETKESLGEEGSAAKGRAATGLHLALERGLAEVREAGERQAAEIHDQLAGLQRAVEALTQGLAEDRRARESAVKVELAKTEAVAEVRAPFTRDLATARAALIGSAVTLALGGIVALVLRHLVWH